MADHLEDFAAVAGEHGDEDLADMLTGEANALRDGSLAALCARAHRAEDEADILHGVAVETLEQLKDAVTLSEKARTARRRASARLGELIEQAWEREGYPAPDGATVTA